MYHFYFLEMRSRQHLPYFIVTGLALSFVFSLTGSFFPLQSPVQNFFFKIDALFAVTAFSCLASKATSEGHDIPAAGFTVLAIAQGLFLAEIGRDYDWDYSTGTVAVLFMIPSLIMISYYTEFPKWVRVLGVVSVIPFVVLMLVRDFYGKANTDIYEIVIFLLYQLVTLCWAFYTFRSIKVKN